MEPFIRLENVKFSYQDEQTNDVAALDGLDFEIKRGEFIALLGANGCGKSTLAKHLNALLLPREGKVFVDGLDTADSEKLYDIRRKVGMVLQNPDNQIVASIVEEDVAFGPENLGLSSSEIRARVDDALRMVDMYEYRLHATHKLSGGQKQRVAIAGALAMHSECIVLDEPTAMLDPQGRKDVLSLIKKLNAENSLTIVLITHHMEEAALADRVAVMSRGKIKLEGTPQSVFSQQADILKKYNLAVPQVTELILKLQRNGYALPGGILTVRECTDALLRLLEGKCTRA